MLNKNRNAVTAACLIAALSLTGCSGTSATTTDPIIAATTAENAETSAALKTAASKPLSIVCTIFPEYDWVREIMGSHAENAEITYLLDNGVDLHSFQPTASDMIKIAECDLFIYVGGESDEWVENALAAKVVATPQEAFYADKEMLPLEQTSGRICSEFVMCYPPGIPILAPGEIITDDIINYIRYAKEKGCSMQGTEDPKIEHLNVLR